MRQDWQYFKCDGCGRLFKFCKDDSDLNDLWLSCYSVDDIGGIEFEFCSEKCCLDYITNKIQEHLKVDVRISSFSLCVNSASSEMITKETENG